MTTVPLNRCSMTMRPLFTLRTIVLAIFASFAPAAYIGWEALFFLLPQNLQEFILLGPERIAIERGRRVDMHEPPVFIVANRRPVPGTVRVSEQGVEHARKKLVVAPPQKLGYRILEVRFDFPVRFGQVRTHANGDRLLFVTGQILRYQRLKQVGVSSNTRTFSGEDTNNSRPADEQGGYEGRRVEPATRHWPNIGIESNCFASRSKGPILRSQSTCAAPCRGFDRRSCSCRKSCSCRSSCLSSRWCLTGRDT